MKADWPDRNVVAEITALLKQTASREKLGQSPILLALVFPEVVPAETGVTKQIQALRLVLQRAIQVAGEGADDHAQHLRAANELLGWTKKSRDEVRSILREPNFYSPSDAKRLRNAKPNSTGAREALAGRQFEPPLRPKQVRNKRAQIARHLADALHDLLEDPATMRDLGAQLGDSGAERGAEVSSSSATAIPSWDPVSAAPFIREALVSYTEGKGVNTYIGPANTYRRGYPENIPEGDVVSIVCQERHGQAVSDPQGDPNRYQGRWPVWDRLSDGRWIPDLYTDLPKIPGDTPPEGIPHC